MIEFLYLTRVCRLRESPPLNAKNYPAPNPGDILGAREHRRLLLVSRPFDPNFVAVVNQPKNERDKGQ